MGSGAALQPCVSFKKPTTEQQQLLRAFFASGEYATAMEGLMKDCPSPGEMPLSRSAPSTDFAAALEAFEADVCAEAVLYDLPSLNPVFGRSPSSAFATADSLDSEATLSFGPPPTRATNGGSSGISPRDSVEDVSKPAALYDADFTFPGAGLASSDSAGAAWAPVTGPFGFDPETDAVDVLALEREFSMVPPARSLMPAIPTTRPGGLVRSRPVKAEAASAAPRGLVSQTVHASVAVLEAVTDAGSDGIVRTESVAADLPDLAAVESALPRLPTMAEAEGCLYTMSPVLWLDLSPPYRLKVNTGLRTSSAPASEAPRTFYGAINPRVITTGCPAKRAAGRQLPYRRPPATRASSSALPDEELPASPTAADAEAAPAPSYPRGLIKTQYTLQEVWLLKRDADRPSDVADSFHSCGPFVGSILPDAPDWATAGSVDVVARVGLPSGERSLWLKAPRRSIQTIKG